jgi:hypothetical protein
MVCVIAALDASFEEPWGQIVFPHCDGFFLEQRVERAYQVIGLLNELNLAIRQRRDGLSCVTRR